MLVLEALDQPIDDPGVDVFAAQERVAGGRDDLEDAARSDLEDRDVEGAAAEVVHRDGLLDVLAEPVRGSAAAVGSLMMRMHVQAGDLTRVLGGLPLVVVEVRGAP